MSDPNGPEGSPTPTVVVGGDVGGGGDGGGNGDGGGSSSSSSGGGASPFEKQAPYRSILLGMRLPPGLFADLLARAAQEQWTANDFLWALSSAKQFNRMFPGIQALLDQGMSVPQAVQTWKATSTAYEQELRNAGLWGFIKGKMTKQNIGLAIERGKDPEEMVFLVGVAQQAKRSEDLRAAFNAILKNKGEAQLDKKGWLKFLLGKSDAKLYDLYEGALLFQEYGAEGGLRVKEARRLARQFGQPGQPVDVTDAIANVDKLRRTIGSQELAGAGLDTADLLAASMAEDISLKNPKLKLKVADTLAKLEQLAANREAAAAAGGQEATTAVGGRPISETAPRT